MARTEVCQLMAVQTGPRDVENNLSGGEGTKASDEVKRCQLDIVWLISTHTGTKLLERSWILSLSGRVWGYSQVMSEHQCVGVLPKELEGRLYATAGRWREGSENCVCLCTK